MLRSTLRVIAIVLIGISNTSFAQENIVDRAQTLQNSFIETGDLYSLDSLIELIYKTDRKTSLSYAVRGENLAISKKNKILIGKFVYLQGLIQESVNKEESKRRFEEALRFTRDSSLIYRINIYLGRINLAQNNIVEARLKFDLALKQTHLDDSKWHSYLLVNISSMYEQMNDLKAAIKYYHEAIKVPRKSSIDELSVSCYSAIGNLYRGLNELDSAEFYLNLALDNQDELKIHDRIELNSFISEVWKLQGEVERAEVAAERAWQMAQQNVDSEFYGTYITNHAYFLNETKRYSQGLDHALVGFDLAKKKGDKFRMSKAYEEVIYSLKNLRDFEEAFEFQTKYMMLKDSMINIETTQQINDLNLKYSTREKEELLKKAETALSKQHTYNGVLGLLTLIFIGFTLLFWYFLRQRKLINDKLRNLNEKKTQFFSNISHELKTPLTLILAPLENALLKVKSKELKKDLTLAYKNSNNLYSLVNELLDFDKLEKGFFVTKNTVDDLEKFLRRVMSIYRPLANDRNVMFEFHYSRSIGLLVEADFIKLEKIINNLLSNAVKFCNRNGVISLTAKESDNYIEISVNDTGIGISEKDLKRIFERYYQAESHNTGGTGIGLSFTKELVNSIGGSIEVNSDLEKGSVFKFTFPYVPVEESSIAIPFNNSDKNFSMVSRAKILVVEDNKDMGEFVASILSTKYTCYLAGDGQHALKILESQHIDLIISDVMMPNMDGFEFLDKVRNSNVTNPIPFIILSAKSLEEDKLKGFRLGVDDYITKPFKANEILARVDNLLLNKIKRNKYKIEDNQSEEIIVDDRIIQEARKIIELNMQNSLFKVSDLAKHLNYSQRQIERILKKKTGMSPNVFIRELRLIKAYALIEAGLFDTVSEVRYSVGFDNASYFSKKFYERFGISPNDLLKRK